MTTVAPSPRLEVTVIFGTRPEAIKLAPVIATLSADERFSVRVVSTGQHREMVREIIGPLGIRLDVDLDIMKPGQSLNDIVLAALSRLDRLFRDDRPDILVVQGDTSTAFAAALAAFHCKIPVAHVEAGLRSHDRLHPYPEESNRRMISALADLHFAPTRRAAENLKAETVPAGSIFVTGNTVIDALKLALRLETATTCQIEPGRDLVLITLHRREAWDGKEEDGSNVLANVLRGIRDAATDHPNATFVYPMHRNPRVRQVAQDLLGSLPNLRLIDPLPYFEFLGLMARSKLIVTDSGGIQEEAPSLGVPVLVLRRTTERPEALQSGWNVLVGTDGADIRAAIAAELRVNRPRPSSIPCPGPFGDGRASERIRDALLWSRNRKAPRPLEFSENESG
jgi:UDP-N-acetylglucosamine 2-epimerase (non-hydrolysing)